MKRFQVGKTYMWNDWTLAPFDIVRRTDGKVKIFHHGTGNSWWLEVQVTASGIEYVQDDDLVCTAKDVYKPVNRRRDYLSEIPGDNNPIYDRV